MNHPVSPAAGSPEADPDGVLEPLGPPLRRPSPPILGPVPTPARADDPADDGGRYRRAARPAPPPGEARGVEDPFASSNDVSLTPASTGSSRAIAEPLAALAAAFQANADALRRSQEMQAELGRALDEAFRRAAGRALDPYVFVALLSALEGLSMELLSGGHAPAAADVARARATLHGLLDATLRHAAQMPVRAA